MDRDSARQEIKMRWREIMPTIARPAQRHVNGEPSWICPICKTHGTHGDGLTYNPKSADRTGLKCFGCGFAGDIIDLYQQVTGADYNTALSSLAAQLGIAIDTWSIRDNGHVKKPLKSAEIATIAAQAGKQCQNSKDVSQVANTTENDYVKYYAICSNHLSQGIEYLQGRGISQSTADRYGIGYDVAEQRIIVPVTESFYIARATAGQAPKYKNPTNRGVQIFNQDAIYSANVVFVCEGVFDALSIIEGGKQAIALNGVSNTAKLLELLRERPTQAILIICLDNDKPGKAAAQSLADGLRDLKLQHTLIGALSDIYKDPNDFLCADRAGFIAALERVERDALCPHNIASYLLDGFDADMTRFKEGGKSTGFDRWDKATTGLHEGGLFMLASAPGNGKTTLAWQICEHLAIAGDDVIYFSMEQLRFDFITKSIARRIRLQNMSSTITNEMIREGDTRALKAMERAKADFLRDVGDRISIVEGNFSLTAKDISDYTERYIARTGRRPVVVVDYLQAVRPISDKDIRAAIDDTTDALCSLKNRHNLCMIVISSVNRASYRAPLDLEGLKESGRLEFDADAVWLLELACMREDLFESDGEIAKKKSIMAKAKGKDPRSMILKCAKSRYCGTGKETQLHYYCSSDLFIEIKDGDFVPVGDGDNTPFDTGNPFRRRK